MKMQTFLFRNVTALGFALWAASAPAVPVFPTDPANAITNTITVPPGWSLIANPYQHNRGTTVLDAVPDNSVGELFKSVPQGTLLFKFDNATQRFSENRFRGRRWSNPSQALLPGEGAWFFNPTRRPFTVAFTGNCMYAGSVEVPAGWSLISSPDCGAINFAPLIWPPPEGCFGVPFPFPFGTNAPSVSTNLVAVPCSPFPPFGWDSLAFNPQEDDVVYTFESGFRQFQSHTFQNGAWDNVPVVGTAEACFVYSTHPRVIRYIGYPPLFDSHVLH